MISHGREDTTILHVIYYYLGHQYSDNSEILVSSLDLCVVTPHSTEDRPFKNTWSRFGCTAEVHLSTLVGRRLVRSRYRVERYRLRRAVETHESPGVVLYIPDLLSQSTRPTLNPPPIRALESAVASGGHCGSCCCGSRYCRSCKLQQTATA